LSSVGRSVLVIERDLSPPDRIVGELLQPGGVAALKQLGMRDCLENIDATPVEGYCVVMGDRQVGIPYPDLMSDKELEEVIAFSSSGRVEGRSFHHGRFVDNLRNKVLKDGKNVRVVEGTVKSLITCDHTQRVIGVSSSVKTDEKDEGGAAISSVKNFYAPLTIVADGCFSKFRTNASTSSSDGSATPSPLKHAPVADIRTRSHFVGLVLKDVPLPLPRHGTVCLTPNGPVLLYQIGNTAKETRMLVDIKGKLPSVGDGSLRVSYICVIICFCHHYAAADFDLPYWLKKHIVDAYLPHLPEQLHPSILSAMEKDRLRVMPNSFLPPKMQGRRGAREGVIMVGDSWNMRHPLTGGGMTVALHDAVLLTRHLAPSESLEDLSEWETIRRRLQSWHWERKHLAGVVNVLSIALYDLFGADGECPAESPGSCLS
jgi:squalene monooxygenase